MLKTPFLFLQLGIITNMKEPSSHISTKIRTSPYKGKEQAASSFLGKSSPLVGECTDWEHRLHKFGEMGNSVL